MHFTPIWEIRGHHTTLLFAEHKSGMVSLNFHTALGRMPALPGGIQSAGVESPFPDFYTPGVPLAAALE
jgi:hypothetical protein